MEASSHALAAHNFKHGRRNQGGKGGWSPLVKILGGQSPPAIAEVLDRLIKAATAYDSLVVQCDSPECIKIHLRE